MRITTNGREYYLPVIKQMNYDVLKRYKIWYINIGYNM